MKFDRTKEWTPEEVFIELETAPIDSYTIIWENVKIIVQKDRENYRLIHCLPDMLLSTNRFIVKGYKQRNLTVHAEFELLDNDTFFADNL